MNKELIDLLESYSELPEYISQSMVTLNSKSIFGNYPINIAATRGSFDEVKLLITNGSDIDSQGEHGYTPLHEAIEQGHKNIVELLLKHGANVMIKNDDGSSPADLALLLGNETIAALFS
ncbi:MAG: ankyrin repeat domain-containing protein [Thiofilum sp.]|uniref:ankyrin repeat domain-containing protein n=1 Tax=Thiofilum sp. TaxID=2212733 RepID=UPI0026002FB9|nr:ankyrin repeat domain-containing protein [Thiofilum sp.]MBK8453792.1 ankyrin repeat domain-containing protein [Thiofilum sp.]